MAQMTTKVSYATTRKGVICSPNTDYTPCYACDKGSVGVAERWTDGKMTLVYACQRHSNPAYKVTDCCMYCGDPVQKGSLWVDGGWAHKKCWNIEAKT